MRTIAIIGAGFSGTLTALHLLRRPEGPHVALIERGAAFGPGLAYGASHSGHLLNVRVGNMSAYPDRPDHLREWLGERGRNDDSAAFIDRRTYGLYLQQQLRHTLLDPFVASRLRLIHDDAVSVDRIDGRLQVNLSNYRSVMSDALVLALGAAPSARPVQVDDVEYVADPWASGALDKIKPERNVVILGSGLTMFDIAHTLIGRGHHGPIIALSRHGLAPKRHQGLFGQTAPEPAAGPLSARLARFRRTAERDWRSAFDALRPYTAAMWAALDDKERARFLRHLRPYWDVHRHRLAPEAAERLDRWIKTGALRVVAGRLTCADRAQITWRIRGSAETQSVGNAVLINCTGPATGLDALSAPVLADLLLKGECRPDPLGLGLDLTADGAVLDASGVARADIYAIGPLARGAFWESTAVPDLRSHAADLARDLCRRLPLFVPTQKVG